SPRRNRPERGTDRRHAPNPRDPVPARRGRRAAVETATAPAAGVAYGTRRRFAGVSWRQCPSSLSSSLTLRVDGSLALGAGRILDLVLDVPAGRIVGDLDDLLGAFDGVDTRHLRQLLGIRHRQITQPSPAQREQLLRELLTDPRDRSDLGQAALL